MGGIRNLEAKKKANHVAASGAIAGANKGPAKVDKRNQELPCPFCDKVYTQAQVRVAGSVLQRGSLQCHEHRTATCSVCAHMHFAVTERPAPRAH
jgi:hypothetical protein